MLALSEQNNVGGKQRTASTRRAVFSTTRVVTVASCVLPHKNRPQRIPGNFSPLRAQVKMAAPHKIPAILHIF